MLPEGEISRSIQNAKLQAQAAAMSETQRRALSGSTVEASRLARELERTGRIQTLQSLVAGYSIPQTLAQVAAIANREQHYRARAIAEPVAPIEKGSIFDIFSEDFDRLEFKRESEYRNRLEAQVGRISAPALVREYWDIRPNQSYPYYIGQVRWGYLAIHPGSTSMGGEGGGFTGPDTIGTGYEGVEIIVNSKGIAVIQDKIANLEYFPYGFHTEDRKDFSLPHVEFHSPSVEALGQAFLAGFHGRLDTIPGYSYSRLRLFV
jgi:hypothetical protein